MGEDTRDGAAVGVVDRSPSGVVAWVERNTGRVLNDNAARCVEVLCSFVQPYNLQLICDGWQGAVGCGEHPDPDWNDGLPPRLAPIEFGQNWVIAHIMGDLATCDFPELTRLVKAAHERAVRVQVSAQMYRATDRESQEPHEFASACLRIGLHAREREGRGWERHPSVEQAFRAPREATASPAKEKP